MSSSSSPSASGQDYQTVVEKIRTTKLSPSVKSVAYSLLSRSGSKLLAFPSVKTIATDSGVSERGVRLALRKLEEEKIILTIPRKRKDGSFTSNVYRFICGLIRSGGGELSSDQEDKTETNERHTGPRTRDASSRKRWNLDPRDFKRPQKCFEIYSIFKSKKWIDDSEQTLVDFFSAWAKCLRLYNLDKIENPGGLLIKTVKGQQLHHFYSNGDQDKGMLTLRHCRKLGLSCY